MHHLNRIRRLVFTTLIILVFWSCSSSRTPLETQTAFVLGTSCSIALERGTERDVFIEAFTLLHMVEETMSRTIQGSEVFNINEQAGRNPVRVSRETFHVIESALDYSRSSRGVFDITIGPLTDLWNIGYPEAAVPDPVLIMETLPLVDFEAVEIDREERTVFLSEQNMRVDLGGIAKGFAADQVVEYLKGENVARGIVDLGGNIYVLGTKKDGTPWRIGVQKPGGKRGSHLGILRAADTAVVTSGIYERYFFEQGKRYHHILDTETGYPVENGLASVTVVSPTAMDADALSTVLFVLGLDAGMEYIETIDGAEALFVTLDSTVSLSSGMEEMFTLSDSSYKIIDKSGPVSAGKDNEKKGI